MARGKLWGGIVVLFIAGVLTGVMGTFFYHHYEQRHRLERGPAARQERMMKRLTDELSLTTAQQANLQPIVHRVHLGILRLRLQHQPEVERLVAEGIADAKAGLSSDQQAKLDEFYARLKARWQESEAYVRAAGEPR